jgi:hypothetical protein
MKHFKIKQLSWAQADFKALSLEKKDDIFNQIDQLTFEKVKQTKAKSPIKKTKTERHVPHYMQQTQSIINNLREKQAETEVKSPPKAK